MSAFGRIFKVTPSPFKILIVYVLYHLLLFFGPIGGFASQLVVFSNQNYSMKDNI